LNSAPEPNAGAEQELIDLYFKKSIEARWGGRNLKLDVPVDVFSSYQIDVGTMFLLREISSHVRKWPRVLDLGCGYGPVSVYLSANGIADAVDAIDPDAVAVAFAEHNARMNNCSNISAAPGTAYSNVAKSSYDAVVSNVPAKAGHPVHTLMLLGAQRHLKDNGEVWIVVVSPLEESFDAILDKPEVKLSHKASRKGHVVYNFSFSGEPAVPYTPYLREAAAFRWREWSYEMTSFHGLAEFDERSHATDLIFHVLEKLSATNEFANVLVGNCGQGHIPVFLAQHFAGLQHMCVASRNLIALEAAKHNLKTCGFGGDAVFSHTPLLECRGEDFQPDLIVAALREREGYDIHLGKASRALARYPGSPLVLACASAKASRLEKALRASGRRASLKTKRKGFCAFLVSP